MQNTALLTDPRIWSNIAESPTGCWEWLGSKNTRGYGRLHAQDLTGRRFVFAHRLVYEILVHEIPRGLVIDHLCRNPRCVNPEHLDPVTDRVNLMRGESPSALASRATRCPSGHPYSGDNLWMWKGIRLCRTCKRQQTRASAARVTVAKRAKRASIPCAHCGGSMVGKNLNATYCSGKCKQRSRAARLRELDDE